MGAQSAGPILLVESDRPLGQAIAEQLIADGFAVALACTVEHARVLARTSDPQLAVLGWVDSPRGALALLEEIRGGGRADAAWDDALPAIVVGARARELDTLRAFEAGADDYVTRPTYLELRARLRAILRRSAHTRGDPPLIELGALRIDTSARSVSVDGKPVTLRRMEFELLLHMARAPERVFSRDELLRAVWQYRSGGSTRTVDSHASRLRRKLARGEAPRWVISVWGIGYRLI